MQNTLPVINYQKQFQSPMPQAEMEAWQKMAKDDQAFRFIWEIYSRPIYNAAIKMLRSEAHAEQVLLDSLVHVREQQGLSAYSLRYLLQKTTLFLIKHHIKVLADEWCLIKDSGVSYNDWLKTQKPTPAPPYPA